MTKPSFLQNTTSSMQFFGFLLLALVMMFLTLIIGGIIAYGIWGQIVIDYLFNATYDLNNQASVNMLKFMQMISQLGLMVFPAFIFAFLVNRNTSEYLSLNKSPQLITVMLSIVLILISAPAINWMIEINKDMKLPEFLASTEIWMHNAEDMSNEISNAFLSNSSISSLIVNLLMIGVLAAVGEELVFRGIIQKIFIRWFKNTHIAVIFTAICFSAFHMQFYGFLPRFMMGILLGYLFVWSGSLWIPIIVHFVNNATAVLISFLSSRGVIETSYEEFGTTDSIYPVLLSCAFIASLVFVIYKKENQQS